MVALIKERRLHTLFTGIGPLPTTPAAFEGRIPVTMHVEDVRDSTYHITYVPRMVPGFRQGRGLHFTEILPTETSAADRNRQNRENRHLLQAEIAAHRKNLARMRREDPAAYGALRHVDDVRPLEPVIQSVALYNPPLLLGPGTAYAAGQKQVAEEARRMVSMGDKLLDQDLRMVGRKLVPYLDKKRQKPVTPASRKERLVPEPTFPPLPPMRELPERIVLEPRLQALISVFTNLKPPEAVQARYKALLDQVRSGGPLLPRNDRESWRHGITSTIIRDAWPHLSEQDYALLMHELRRRNYPSVPAPTVDGLTKVLEGRPGKISRHDKKIIQDMFSVRRPVAIRTEQSAPVSTAPIRFGVDKQSVRHAWNMFRARKPAIVAGETENISQIDRKSTSDTERNRKLQSDPIYGVAARNRLLRDAAYETHRDVGWLHPRFALLYRQFTTEPGERQYAAHDIPMLLDAAYEVMKNSEDRRFVLRLLLEERQGLYEVVGYENVGGTLGKVARFHVRAHNRKILERATAVLDEGIAWSRRKIPLTRSYWKTDMSKLARIWIEDFNLEGMDELAEAVGIAKSRIRPTSEMIFTDISGSRTLPDVAALLRSLADDEARIARTVDDHYVYPTTETLALVRHAYRRVHGMSMDSGLTISQEADVLELATEMVNRPGAFRFTELIADLPAKSETHPFVGRRKIRRELPLELVSSIQQLTASEPIRVKEEIVLQLIADFFHNPVEGIMNNAFLLRRIQDPSTPAATQRIHLAAMLENFARREIELGSPLGKALAGVHLPSLTRLWAYTDYLASERVIGKPLKTSLFM